MRYVVPATVHQLKREAGAQKSSSLPMQVGSEIDLNLSYLVKNLSFLTPDNRARAIVKWTKQQGPNHSTGLHFTRIDEDLRTQLMKWCLRSPGAGGWRGN